MGLLLKNKITRIKISMDSTAGWMGKRIHLREDRTIEDTQPGQKEKTDWKENE